MKKPLRVFLWAPEFTNRPGGVQQYTRDVQWALEEIVDSENVRGLAYGEVDPRSGQSIPATCVSVAGYPRVLRGLAFAVAAWQICLKFRPGVIFSTFPRFAPVGIPCAKWFGIPFVTAAHGVEIWGRQDSILRRSLGAADRILAVSAHTAARLRDENEIPKERVFCLPNCVDSTRFCPGPRPEGLARRLDISVASARVLLTVARMDASERAKGVEVVLRALPEILRKIPAAVYVIVGDGSDRGRLEALARELGVAPAVRFAGRAGESELPDFYRLCDCFVMPSSKEGFGIVFLEAMSTGKPVIAGDRDGAREPLRDGALGWLVNADSPQEVARGVTEAICGTPQDPRRDGEFLRRETIEHFGREAFRNGLARHLSAVAKG